MTTSIPIKIDNKKISEEFLNQFDSFLFDCDGVLWLGNHLLPNTIEYLDMLAELGKQVFFVTNNSTKSRKSYVKKFETLGITVNEEQIFSSGYASALYVRDFLKLKPGEDKIWVFGETGIKEELESMGYEVLGCNDPRLNTDFDATTSPFFVEGIDPKVRAVIAGLDTKINYHKLAVTMQYLQHDNVEFIGTNVDSTFPQKGLHLPGTGSMVESIAFSSGRRPTYCGKPNLNMLNAIITAKELEKEKTCMVGDRLNTDIRFGVEGKLGGTLLVLSGIETEETILALPSDSTSKPKYYAENLGKIYKLMRE